MKTLLASLLLTALLSQHATSQNVQTISLLPPDTAGGMPLMQALHQRHSSRTFADHPLTAQQLSNVLWAAFGINRPDGRRTAPSARNWQEIDVYVFLASGVYLYHPRTHSLQQIDSADHRAETGTQDFAQRASVNLVYVADLARVSGRSGDEVDLFIGADCGFIAQNVYLYGTSEGLSVVVRGLLNRERVAKLLGLRANQRVLLSQSIGHAK